MILLSDDGQMFAKIFPAVTIDKLHAVPCSADPDNIFFAVFVFLCSSSSVPC